jgi:hypothetical protein
LFYPNETIATPNPGKMFFAPGSKIFVNICHKRTHAPQQNAAYSITSSAVASSVGEMAIGSRIYRPVTMDIHAAAPIRQ